MIKSFCRTVILAAVLILQSVMHPVMAADPVSPEKQPSLQLTKAQIEWLDEHENILVGAMNNWPPLNFINDDGRADGFGVALVALINQQLGGRLKLINGDWPRIYQSVADKKLDVALDITRKPEREHLFNFTNPYLDIPHVIVSRKSGKSFRDEQQLAGKNIALEHGFSNVDYYKKHFPEINILEYPDTLTALRAVINGEAEAYIGNLSVVDYLVQTQNLNQLKVHALATKTGSVLSMGVRKDWPVLAEILQQALDNIPTQEYYAILDDIIEQQTALNDRTIVNLTPDEWRWLRDHKEIRLASKGTNPPMDYIDEYGTHRGVSADFLTLLEKRLGVTFIEPAKQDWAISMNQLRTREVDLVTTAIATVSRANFASYTQPYVTNTMAVVTQDWVDFIPGIEGLLGHDIAIVDGCALSGLLTKENPQLQLKKYKSVSESLAAVSRGEAFAFIGNISSASYLTKELGLSNLKVSGELPYNFAFSFGVRSDWPELTSILNKAIASISPEERAEIYSRWVSLKQAKNINWQWIITLISVLCLLVIVILYWNYLLNKKVKSRTADLEHRACHDELTELPNRKALMEHLNQKIQHIERRDRKLFAVLFIDLDDFKKVNDSLGHSVGDDLLMAVTKRLKASLRKVDSLFRFGGDEFVVVTDNVKNKDDIEAICVHLLKAIGPAYRLEHISVKMTMSLGIACYDHDGKNAEQLLRNADIAMYEAKNSGRNHFRFFSTTFNEHMIRRIQLEEQLSNAIENHEISLAFQPIVNLNDGQVSSFEALARWTNKNLGFVSPVEFIALAERNGYIIPLGNYVLDNALKQCAHLCRQFNKEFSISVNVSPKQINNSDFIKVVNGLLTKHKMSPSNLILEITEGVLIHPTRQTEETIRELSRLGIRLSMDDFGTGYSSLSYLRSYPFDILKIDKEFIQDITDQSNNLELVQSLLAMAKSIGLDVVAEGVETEEHSRKLREIGCPKAQGYYYAKPLPDKALIGWLEEHYQSEIG